MQALERALGWQLVLGLATGKDSSDLGSAALGLIMNGYSRKQEMEADSVGQAYLFKAGYETGAMQRMLVRIGIQWMKGNTNRLTLTHFHEIEDLLKTRPRGTIVHLPQGICIQKNLQYLVLFRN